MTQPLQRSIDAFREKTHRQASPEFAPAVLDRLGLADRYGSLESPIGRVFVAWNPRGISAVRQATDAEAFEQWFRRRFGRRALPSDTEPDSLALVRRALAGEKVEIDIDLRDCTPFEAAVLGKAREIGRGHARPYAWVAREIGRPRAMRGVGTALAKNPVPLLIPCHRIVRSDYSCGDYVFGSDEKRRLLSREGVNLPAIQETTRKGNRFICMPDEGYFCLPGCGHIIDEPKGVHVHSADEALEMGLRPCGVCRPLAA